MLDGQLDGARRRRRRGRRSRAFRPDIDGRHHGAELSVLALRAARAARAAATLLRALAGVRRHRRSPSGRTARPRRAPTLRKLGADVVVLRRVRGGRWPRWPTPAAWAAAGHSILRATATRSSSGRAARGRHDATCRRCAGRTSWLARHQPSSPPLRRAARRAGRRDGGLARLPVSLHLLREGQLPRRLPQAAARRRSLEELDGLIAQGVEYVYFIDEIFLPNARRCCEALVERDDPVRRADAHRPLEARACSSCSGAAGCVSIEAGVESITERRPRPARQELQADDRRAGRAPDLRQAARAVRAGQSDRDPQDDDPAHGRSAGASSCRRTASGRTSRCRCSRIRARPTTAACGARRTTHAWERAHDALPRAASTSFSDIQEQRPLPLRGTRGARARSDSRRPPRS